MRNCHIWHDPNTLCLFFQTFKQEFVPGHDQKIVELEVKLNSIQNIELIQNTLPIYELPRGKTNNVVSEWV